MNRPQRRRRHRDGDKGTRGRGQGKKEIVLLFSLSPCLPLSLSPCLPLSVAWAKKSGRKFEKEARLSGLSSRRVLFSLFFVSNFETDLWDQALHLDQ